MTVLAGVIIGVALVLAGSCFYFAFRADADVETKNGDKFTHTKTEDLRIAALLSMVTLVLIAAALAVIEVKV